MSDKRGSKEESDEEKSCVVSLCPNGTMGRREKIIPFSRCRQESGSRLCKENPKHREMLQEMTSGAGMGGERIIVPKPNVQKLFRFPVT